MNPFSSYLETLGEFGIVEEINHPIITVVGLPHARVHEIVIFETGEYGEIFSLARDTTDILLFSQNPVRAKTRVARTNLQLSIQVGDQLLGRVISPRGDLLFSDAGYVQPKEEREIDQSAPGIASRERIKQPFRTGVSVVDMMIPIGKGQRQLVLGDRKTGKSSFLLSTIKNQINEGAVAIYCAIGKKKSDIKKLEEFLLKEGILQKTCIVATSAFDSPSLIYLTPYAGMTIAEYFRDKGINVVIVLDDLSTHAKFYREISLIAKNFPGRDSYPGDIFYAHAKLLERAGNFKHPTTGEVSITCLPVVETIEGDFTSYITTNVMGMTDGHIFFDSNIYYKGRRPAINIPLSVTRVGRQTQLKFKRDITRELTSFLTIYERMQNLSHFGAELTESVKNVLKNGERVYSFFDQQANVIVPETIQLVLFSMLWLRLLSDEDMKNISVIRNNFIESYKNPQTQTMLAELLKADSFNGLLGNVAAKKDILLSLCKKNAN